MVVMAVAHLLIAGAALAKVMPLDDAGVLEQLDGPVHRRDRDLVVDGYATAVQFLDIGMIERLRQHARDHPALFGHSHASGGATRLYTGGLERGGRFQGSHGLGLFNKACSATARGLRPVAAHQKRVQLFPAGLLVIALAPAGDTKSGAFAHTPRRLLILL